jgi:hypothetical protein
MRSPDHVPIQSAAPTYAAARPVYIGLRLIRYGPLVTSVDTGLCGTTVVRGRRKVAVPDALSASPAVVWTAPTAVVTGRPGKGNGSQLCRPRPPTTRSTNLVPAIGAIGRPLRPVPA